MQSFLNPFRPGAGYPPPYLAGREKEVNQFLNLLKQKPILKNLVITGLRGVGKTVLLEDLKTKAISHGWFWAGTDLSEAASLSESNLSIRILTDLSTLIASFSYITQDKVIGFKNQKKKTERPLNYQALLDIYNTTPGLEADKLKEVLGFVWDVVKDKVSGVVLAYDEAQILKDKAENKQYPLSLLLEIIQYIQRKEIPFLLVLTGLPTIVNTLSEARTYTERMFEIIMLQQLGEKETRDAITIPIKKAKSSVTFNEYGIAQIINFFKWLSLFYSVLLQRSF